MFALATDGGIPRPSCERTRIDTAARRRASPRRRSVCHLARHRINFASVGDSRTTLPAHGTKRLAQSGRSRHEFEAFYM